MMVIVRDDSVVEIRCCGGGGGGAGEGKRNMDEMRVEEIRLSTRERSGRVGTSRERNGHLVGEVMAVAWAPTTERENTTLNTTANPEREKWASPEGDRGMSAF
ncbi:hypothetical protein Pcinc_041829 [Petrolisthes cinctipes]|uniref:Uncharacterized protein n=1 Tax=Petrolisthes cinctipes TaxID=88211 RepID=A0AAE1EGL3_PETCI|nr:hypothetical protein Pcinc_041829 [Petrolisthes cinctipes]